MTEQQKNVLKDPAVELFLLPTPRMLEIILANQHPVIQKLNADRKSELLTGNGILLEKQMVIDYMENKLDANNKFLLDLGEIRVFGAEEVIVKKMK